MVTTYIIPQRKYLLQNVCKPLTVHIILGLQTVFTGTQSSAVFKLGEFFRMTWV